MTFSLAGREVEFVVNHDDLLSGGDAESADKSPDRLARLVHVGDGKREDDAFVAVGPAKTCFGEQCVVAAAFECLNPCVRRAALMASSPTLWRVPTYFWARVAETDDEPVKRIALADASKEPMSV